MNCRYCNHEYDYKEGRCPLCRRKPKGVNKVKLRVSEPPETVQMVPIVVPIRL